MPTGDEDGKSQCLWAVSTSVPGWSLWRRTEGGLRENVLAHGDHAQRVSASIRHPPSPGRLHRKGQDRPWGFHPGWKGSGWGVGIPGLLRGACKWVSFEAGLGSGEGRMPPQGGKDISTVLPGERELPGPALVREGLVGTKPGWVSRSNPTVCSRQQAAGKGSRSRSSRDGRPAGRSAGHRISVAWDSLQVETRGPGGLERMSPRWFPELLSTAVGPTDGPPTKAS